MDIDSNIVKKLLDADLVNIAKRIQEGKPVTQQQRALLEESVNRDKPDGDDECYSINKLSEILSVDRRTLTKYLRDIKPDKVNGKIKLYKLGNVVETLGEVGGEKSERQKLECKKLIAQIRQIDLRNDELAKRLIPAEEIQRVWLNHIGKARGVLLKLEDLAPVLVGLNVNQIKAKLKQASESVIAELNEAPTHESESSENT